MVLIPASRAEGPPASSASFLPTYCLLLRLPASKGSTSIDSKEVLVAVYVAITLLDGNERILTLTPLTHDSDDRVVIFPNFRSQLAQMMRKFHPESV